MRKPSVAPSKIRKMLRQRWGDVSDLDPLAEGLCSQAFGFRLGGAEYVVRVNESIEGFEKDRFVSRRFASRDLPIPEVLDVGCLDGGHAFCISRRAPGVRLHELDAAALARMVAPVAQVLAAIAASDLAGTAGFGRFDTGGVAPDASWREFLTGVADPSRFDWAAAGLSADNVVGEALRRIDALAGHCPEERCLVHGDFGAYNVLTDGHGVTGVIDWDLALFGDPLYDVANLFFWHEARLEPLIQHFAGEISHLPRWRERILCYQLRTGLQEIYESAVGIGPGDVGWLTARCEEIMDPKRAA